MKKQLIKFITGSLGFLAICETAYAGAPAQVPEPDILSLLVAGGIVSAVVAIRNRRK